MNKSEKKPNNAMLRCIAIAVASGIGVILLLLAGMSIILTAGVLPLGAVEPVSIIIGCMGAFASGFVCSRINKKKGFFLGLVCAIILFTVLFLVSFAIVAKMPGTLLFVKLFAMLLCGAVGGSVGVNLKKKI